MDYREHIRERCELAQTYADDGAYHSAASILSELAEEVRQHAIGVSPLPKEPTYSARMGTARNEVVEKLVEHFEKSGVQYTCLAVVHRTIEPELARLAADPRYSPYNVNTRRTINRAADTVHKRWRERMANEPAGAGFSVREQADGTHAIFFGEGFRRGGFRDRTDALHLAREWAGEHEATTKK